MLQTKAREPINAAYCLHTTLIPFLLQIIETENMMDRIVNGLSESSIKVRLAAVRQEAFLFITDTSVLSQSDALPVRISAKVSSD